MVKTVSAGILSALLICVVSVGCQTSDTARRQNIYDAGVSSERLTYRQYQVTPQVQAREPLEKVGLFEFFNPFKSRSHQTDTDSSSVPATINISPSGQRPPVSQVPDTLTNHSRGQVPLLREDDPPDMVEFSAILNVTDSFSDEQKAEILELLRHESPAMRGRIMANYMVAIRRSDKNGDVQSPSQNPIMQASYQASDFMGEYQMVNPEAQNPESETSVSSVRFADYTMEGGMPSNAGLYDASDTTENSQGMIRQVADQSMRNGASIRIVRPANDPGTIPQIDTNPPLPIVAAPNDFTPLHNMGSTVTASDVSLSELDTLTDSREVLPIRQYREPTAPVAPSPGITSSPLSGNRIGNRVGGTNGTMIAIVDPSSRVPQIMPALSDEDDEVEEYDSVIISQGAGDTATPVLEDVGPDRMIALSHRASVDTAFPRDLYPESQPRSTMVPYPPENRDRESWNETAKRALNLLNTQIANSDSLEHKEQLQYEINQRLMSLTLGNQRDAVQPIDGLPKDLQEFWRNTLIALSTMLDDVSFTDASYRFDAAHSHLQTANSFLQKLCPVRIRKLSFINQCDGFGVYETAPNEFQRGEPIFIYAEIDNLTCRESDGGYLTQVGSSYEIIDVLGNKVATGEFGKTGKNTQSRIRDVFMLWRVDLPENIIPGKYFISLSVIDTNHQDSLFDRQRLELNVLSPLSNR